MTNSKLTLPLLITVFSFFSTHIEAQSVGHNTNDTTNRMKSSYNILNNPTSILDPVVLQNKEEIMKQLEDVDFVSGTIFFSGANFGNVISTSPQGKGSAIAPKRFFDRCIVGSRVSFFKCQIRNSNGTISILNKSIVFR